jgi:carbon monoxide dehydrogenase subunit G
MPTVRHEIEIAAAIADVWDAVRDVGALHTRLVPGFVTATEMLQGRATPTRRVTFANGTVLDEIIVTVDDARRRLVWAIKALEHHNGAIEVFESAEGARVVWTADVLPHELVDRFSPLMQTGLQIMKETLQAARPSAGRERPAP